MRWGYAACHGQKPIVAAKPVVGPCHRAMRGFRPAGRDPLRGPYCRWPGIVLFGGERNLEDNLGIQEEGVFRLLLEFSQTRLSYGLPLALVLSIGTEVTIAPEEPCYSQAAVAYIISFSAR